MLTGLGVCYRPAGKSKWKSRGLPGHGCGGVRGYLSFVWEGSYGDAVCRAQRVGQY
jgi:hypothetical protein